MPDSTRPTVLLLTHSRDVFTVDRVRAALEERGARVVRLDTDLYPGDVTLTAELVADGLAYRLDAGDDGPVAAAEVAAVWTRSLWPPASLDDLAPQHRDGAARQVRCGFDGFLDGLVRARWLNDPERNRCADGNKPRQLRLAREAGLAVPPTLVTNDPDEVRRFFDLHDGRVVTKLLAPLSTSMNRTGPFVGTNDLAADDLEHLDGLRYGPMIFQPKLAKAYEVRAMVVDGKLFAGRIDADAEGATDWRLSSGDATWRPAEVPSSVAERLRLLTVALGLGQGVADLVVTPEGEHVFLEVNAVGEWGMLERDLDLPISRAIADALWRRATERRRAS